MFLGPIKRLCKSDNKGLLGMLLVLLVISLELMLFFQLHDYCAVSATSDETVEQLTLSFLEHVARINLTDYNITFTSVFGLGSPDLMYSEIYVGITLRKNSNTLNFQMTFLDGRLWICELVLSSVELVGEKTFNESLLTAIQAVDGYRHLFNLTYCDELHSMISTALQNQSLVVENDNALLNISYVGNLDLVWFKKIRSQFTNRKQSLSMSISKNGLLTMFMDNLARWHIASTDVNMSEQEAINISIPYAEAYAEKHGQKILYTNATLCWIDDSGHQRGSDDFAMYPVWSVFAMFDKTNEEFCFGYSVAIWADNSQIASCRPQGIEGTPRSSDSFYPWLMLAIIALILAFMCLGICLRRKIKSRGA